MLRISEFRDTSQCGAHGQSLLFIVGAVGTGLSSVWRSGQELFVIIVKTTLM